jgi:hypothetical protein
MCDALYLFVSQTRAFLYSYHENVGDEYTLRVTDKVSSALGSWVVWLSLRVHRSSCRLGHSCTLKCTRKMFIAAYRNLGPKFMQPCHVNFGKADPSTLHVCAQILHVSGWLPANCKKIAFCGRNSRARDHNNDAASRIDSSNMTVISLRQFIQGV